MLFFKLFFNFLIVCYEIYYIDIMYVIYFICVVILRDLMCNRCDFWGRVLFFDLFVCEFIIVCEKLGFCEFVVWDVVCFFGD